MSPLHDYRKCITSLMSIHLLSSHFSKAKMYTPSATEFFIRAVLIAMIELLHPDSLLGNDHLTSNYTAALVNNGPRNNPVSTATRERKRSARNYKWPTIFLWEVSTETLLSRLGDSRLRDSEIWLSRLGDSRLRDSEIWSLILWDSD
jgi:hypothetical protein